MTTLQEILDEARNPGFIGSALYLADRIEAWAYGEEKECPTAHGHGRCPTCHGTGTISTERLVFRVMGYSRDDVYERLEQELGRKP